MKKYSWILISALLVTNLYQIYINYTFKHQSDLQQSYNVKNDSSSNRISTERPFFYEEFFLQNVRLPKSFKLLDLRGNLIDNSNILDKNGLVLYFNDFDCSSCNINKVLHFLNICDQLKFDKLTIVTNFERHKEFVKFVSETGINRYSVYNSDLNMKSLYTDTIILFYLQNSIIKYPLVVSSENYNIFPAYLTFILGLPYFEKF